MTYHYWTVIALLWVLVRSSVPQGQPLIYHISENDPLSQPIANLTRDAQVLHQYTSDELAEIRFRFGNQQDRLSGKFLVTSSSGILSLQEAIDRDEDCPERDTCEIQLSIITSPAEYSHLFRVTVVVHDENDNTPEFPVPRYSLDIIESTPVGTEFSLPIAEDLDSAVFGVRRYDLIPDVSQFSLREYNSSDGYLEARLKIVQPLDREMQEIYRFRLLARDGAHESGSTHTGSLSVDVNVLDANDNTPEFERSEYTDTIAEDTRIGSSIIRVHAMDADDTAVITYGFTVQTAEQFGNVFGIDSEHGDIYTRATLDRESVESYVLHVQATDGGATPQTAFCRVTITLQDINDNPPEIRVSSLSGGGIDQVSVPEESAPRSAVAHITATDRDVGNGGLVTCSLQNPYFELEELRENEYTLKTLISMDREVQNEYRVEIICNDRGHQHRTTTREIVVRVADINDHYPVFHMATDSLRINERNAVGSFLLQLNATDADADGNGAVMFKFADGADDRLIDLNPISGVMRANVEFDYETRAEHDFVVLAYDQGNPSLSSTATIHISVDDINDEPPVFASEQYSFHVYEEQASHTRVGVVQATDADSPPFNDIRYFIDYSGDEFNSFIIDEHTGEIFTTRRLDRERRPSYVVIVRAVNPGIVHLENAVNVTIEVADKNDNTPIVLFPNADNNTIYISPTTARGTVVATVVARDDDGGIAGELSYVSVDNDTFFVNPNTGDVVAQRNLTIVDKTFFDLLVNVSDHGSPPRYVITHLYIRVDTSGQLSSSEDDGAFVEFIRNNLLFLIIGIVLVILFLCLCSVVIAVFYRYRRNHKKKQEKYNGNAIVLANKEPITEYQKRECGGGGDDEDKKKGYDAAVMGVTDEGSLQRKGVTFSMETGETSTDDPLWNTALHMARLENSAHRLALDGSSSLGRGSGTATELPPHWSPTYVHKSLGRLAGGGALLGDELTSISDTTTSIGAYTGPAFSRGRASPNNYVHLAGTGDGSSTSSSSLPPLRSTTGGPATGAGGGAGGGPPSWGVTDSLYQPTRSYNSMSRASPMSPLTEMEMEVHEMLEILRQEQDSENDSYTDSGRGPSEEGDPNRDQHNRQSPLDVSDKQEFGKTNPGFTNGYAAPRNINPKSAGKFRRKLSYPNTNPPPLQALSTGGENETSFTMSSDEHLAYPTDVLCQRLEQQKDTTGKRSTDAGKIHISNGPGNKPTSPSDVTGESRTGECVYATPHVTTRGKPPHVPVRTSSFNATNDIKPAPTVTSPGATTVGSHGLSGRSLKVHDHPPSGHRQPAPREHLPFSTAGYNTTTSPLSNKSILNNRDSLTSPRTVHPPPVSSSTFVPTAKAITVSDLPRTQPHCAKLSSTAAKPRGGALTVGRPPVSPTSTVSSSVSQRPVGHPPHAGPDLESVGSPTTMSEDDNTTTSGSFYVDSWEQPRTKHNSRAKREVTSDPVQHPHPVHHRQQALV